MPDSPAQNLSNHAKFDPPFHFVMAPIALTNFIVQVLDLYRNPSASTGWHVVMAVAIVIATFKIRIYSLKVQDRVIRLEERLRLASLLPASVHHRIPELRVGQLVALRFASDAELPALFEKTLAENLKGGDIKKAIRTWRPDTYRV